MAALPNTPPRIDNVLPGFRDWITERMFVAESTYRKLRITHEFGFLDSTTATHFTLGRTCSIANTHAFTPVAGKNIGLKVIESNNEYSYTYNIDYTLHGVESCDIAVCYWRAQNAMNFQTPRPAYVIAGIIDYNHTFYAGETLIATGYPEGALSHKFNPQISKATVDQIEMNGKMCIINIAPKAGGGGHGASGLLLWTNRTNNHPNIGLVGMVSTAHNDDNRYRVTSMSVMAVNAPPGQHIFHQNFKNNVINGTYNIFFELNYLDNIVGLANASKNALSTEMEYVSHYHKKSNFRSSNKRRKNKNKVKYNNCRKQLYFYEKEKTKRFKRKTQNKKRKLSSRFAFDQEYYESLQSPKKLSIEKRMGNVL